MEHTTESGAHRARSPSQNTQLWRFLTNRHRLGDRILTNTQNAIYTTKATGWPIVEDIGYRYPSNRPKATHNNQRYKSGTILSKWLGKNKGAMVIIGYRVGTNSVLLFGSTDGPSSSCCTILIQYGRGRKRDSLWVEPDSNIATTTGTRTISNSTLTRSFHPFRRHSD